VVLADFGFFVSQFFICEMAIRFSHIHHVSSLVICKDFGGSLVLTGVCGLARTKRALFAL